MITMTTTVPIAMPRCNDLTFDHAVSVADASGCVAFFEEGGPEQYRLNLRVTPAPGCNSHNYLMQFEPFARPGESIWQNYVPSNITVRLNTTCSLVKVKY